MNFNPDYPLAGDLFDCTIPGFDAAEHIDRKRSVCLTGHRPEELPLDGIENLRLEANEEIERLLMQDYDTFFCGMAAGSDIILGELVLSYHEMFPMTKLVAVQPFPGQVTAHWPQEWKKRYRRLWMQADLRITLYDSYFRGVYLARNRYMVDHSSVILGIYNGREKGGTAYTIRYAEKRGLEKRIIDPRKFNERF